MTSTSSRSTSTPRRPSSTRTSTRSAATGRPRTSTTPRSASPPRPASSIHPDQIESRTALRVRSGERLSFGTYFNAFPASYWRRWTVVKDVELTVDGDRRAAPPSSSTSRWPTATPSASTRPSTGPEAGRHLRLRAPAQAVRRRRLVLVRRRRRRRRRGRRVRGVDRGGARGPRRARHRRHRDHHDEPPRLLRQAARPDRRRRGAAPLPRHRAGDGAGHRQGHRLAVLREGAKARSARPSGSSSRATSAAPAATPAASSSRCARAPRPTR